MIFDLRRAPRALVRSAGAVLALVVALSIVAPPAARSERPGNAPEIVSVDVTGNLHVPTATIMQVVQARPGEVVRSEDRARRSRSASTRWAISPTSRRRSCARVPTASRSPIAWSKIRSITKIAFTGNKSVPNDTLLALMDLSVGQVFNSNTFRSDVLKINNYYERIGYGGQVPTHVKDVNFDSQDRRADADAFKKA